MMDSDSTLTFLWHSSVSGRSIGEELLEQKLCFWHGLDAQFLIKDVFTALVLLKRLVVEPLCSIHLNEFLMSELVAVVLFQYSLSPRRSFFVAFCLEIVF